MSRLTRDGTAESVSRNQILRRKRGRGNINFLPCSADQEQDWQPYPVIIKIGDANNNVIIIDSEESCRCSTRRTVIVILDQSSIPSRSI